MTLLQGLFTEIINDVKDEMELLFNYGNAGTDNTTATSSQTSLVTEVFRKAIFSFDKTSPTSITASLEIGAGEANGNIIVETGWNDTVTSGGTQLTRNVVNPINKTSDIVLYLDTSIAIEVKEI